MQVVSLVSKTLEEAEEDVRDTLESGLFVINNPESAEQVLSDLRGIIQDLQFTVDEFEKFEVEYQEFLDDQ